MDRVRVAHANDTVAEVGQYLPQNYKVIGIALDGKGVIIAGHDHLGWGLHSYVIPRLGSGLIACTEIEV